jgi:molecular chaperone DnaK
VFDLGGGTFDITILDVGDGVFEVKATNGDTFLGGDDFDQRIIDWVATEFETSDGINIRKDRQALQRLKEAAEKAKIELSTMMETEINLPFITADSSGPKHLNIRLSRSKLEQLNEDLISRCIGPCRQALEDSELKTSDIDQVILVGGMTRMPAIQEAVREFFGRSPHKGVNPDEVVAVGAAIQAGVLGGEVKDILLLDVTPLTLSIETLGGVATPLIDRNTTIPTRKTQVFSTASDNQKEVEIHVVQGERPMAANNKSLGKFSLDGIPPAPRGVPQIEVTFDINADGILNVNAMDKATGRSQKITIHASSGLSDEEVEKMRSDAEAYADEDRARREIVEARNAADNAIYSAEKLRREAGERISDQLRGEVGAKISDVRTALENEDAEVMRLATEALKETMQEVASTMQQAETEDDEEAADDAPDGTDAEDEQEPTAEDDADEA